MKRISRIIFKRERERESLVHSLWASVSFLSSGARDVSNTRRRRHSLFGFAKEGMKKKKNRKARKTEVSRKCRR